MQKVFPFSECSLTTLVAAEETLSLYRVTMKTLYSVLKPIIQLHFAVQYYFQFNFIQNITEYWTNTI